MVSTRPARGIGRRGSLEECHRARDQEAPRARILVNRFLECQDEIRRTLDLVDHCRLPGTHEAYGIVLGETPELVVVQGDEGRPSRSAIRRANVVFPDCRGPTNATMRVSPRAVRPGPRHGEPRSCFRAWSHGRVWGVQCAVGSRLFRSSSPSNSECSVVQFGIYQRMFRFRHARRACRSASRRPY